MILHLTQPGFKWSACGPFTQNKEKMEKFKEAGDSRCIYQSKIDKVSFQHNMTNGDFNDLTRRTSSDKTLRDKSFNIAKNPNNEGCKMSLASKVYKFLWIFW